MKYAYVIRLYFADINFYMPYIFTSKKEAYLYGEYKFKTDADIISYKIRRFVKMKTRFYALK